MGMIPGGWQGRAGTREEKKIVTFVFTHAPDQLGVSKNVLRIFARIISRYES